MERQPFVNGRPDNSSLSSYMSARFHTGAGFQQNRIASSRFSDVQQGQEPTLCTFVILMTTKDQSAMHIASHLPLQFTAS